MPRIDRALILSWVLLAFSLPQLASAAQGGTASLVLDIETREPFGRETAMAGKALPLGSSALLPIEESSSGYELWVTDGTDSGTRPLFDLCPGPCSSCQRSPKFPPCRSPKIPPLLRLS